jgi:hypothetical protein
MPQEESRHDLQSYRQAGQPEAPTGKGERAPTEIRATRISLAWRGRVGHEQGCCRAKEDQPIEEVLTGTDDFLRPHGDEESSEQASPLSHSFNSSPLPTDQLFWRAELDQSA